MVSAEQIDITAERGNAFAQALVSAAPGDEIIYHVGRFCAGPHKVHAMAHSEAGLCILYQRRAEKGQFAYIARKPRK